MSNKLLSSTLLLIFVAFTASTATAYYSGFESDQDYLVGVLQGQDGWSSDASVVAEVTSTDALKGTASLYLPAVFTEEALGSVFKDIALPLDSPVVFLQVLIRPSVQPIASAQEQFNFANLSLGTFENESGDVYLYAYEEEAQVWIPFTEVKLNDRLATSTSTIELTLRLDLSSEAPVADLFIDEQFAYSAWEMTPLASADSLTVSISNSFFGDVLVDELRLQDTNPLFVDTDKNFIPDTFTANLSESDAALSGAEQLALYSQSLKVAAQTEGSTAQLIDFEDLNEDSDFHAQYVMLDNGLRFECIQSGFTQVGALDLNITNLPYVNKSLSTKINRSELRMTSTVGSFDLYSLDLTERVQRHWSDGLAGKVIGITSAGDEYYQDFAYPEHRFDDLNRLILNWKDIVSVTILSYGEGFSVDNLFVGFIDNSDLDLIADTYELATFGSLEKNGALDSDGDQLTDAMEFLIGTNPLEVDTDSDTFTDYEENLVQTDPLDSAQKPDSRDTGAWALSVIGDISLPSAIVSGNQLAYQVSTPELRVSPDAIAWFNRTVKGDFDLKIRVHNLNSDLFSPESGVGIMLRDSEQDNSAVLLMKLFPSSYGRVIERKTTGAWPSRSYHSAHYSNTFFPDRWLRVIRTGAVVRFYTYEDPEMPILFKEVTHSIKDSALLGFFASSETLSGSVGASFEVVHFSQDSDRDGLTDSFELSIGSNIDLADTDNDGVSDYAEVHSTYTDPTQVDYLLGELVSEQSATASVAIQGDWVNQNGARVASSARGELEFEVNVEATSSYRFEIEVSKANMFSSSAPFRLHVSIDGQNFGILSIPATYPEAETAYVYVPYLTEGTHTVHLKWINGNIESLIKIHSLSLRALIVSDLDNNGYPDWLDTRSDKFFSIKELPDAIYTSPYCLQGTIYDFNTLTLTAENADTQIEEELLARPGLRGAFYGNVDLSPQGTVAVTAKEYDGLASKTVDLQWSPLNMLTTETFDVRLNDSVRLSAKLASDAVTQSVRFEVSSPSGELTEIITDSATPVVQLFDEAGVWTVQTTVEQSEGLETIQTVTLISIFKGSLQPAPIVMVNRYREWLPVLSDNEITLYADEMVDFYEITEEGDSERVFNLGIYDLEPSSVIATVPERGDIIDSVVITPVENYTQNHTKHQKVETFDDGSVLIKAVIELSEIPQDLEVRLRFFKSGVTLEDGTIERIITADDFNEQGIYTYYILRSPDVKHGNCHSIRFYQGDALFFKM